MRTLPTVSGLALLALAACSAAPDHRAADTGSNASPYYGATGSAYDASGNDWHDAARRNSMSGDPRYAPSE